jgi:catechol-2,3-dioxygenase
MHRSDDRVDFSISEYFMNLGGLHFSHMGIYVRDLGIMEEFYCRMLDFTVTDRGDLKRNGRIIQLVFLSKDPDEHHQIVLAAGRPEADGFNPINQISLKAGTLETLVSYHRRFLDENWTDIDPISHGNAVSFYVPDPEGNRLELYWDTPWYVSQPMAQQIDLTLPAALLLERVEAQARALPGFKSHAEWRAEMVARMSQD